MSSWFLSFYFGLRQLRSVMATLHVNSHLLTVESGYHPEWSHIPEAPEVLREKVKQYGTRAGRFHLLQVRALLAGVFFYVVWHILEMYLRQPPTF